MKYIKKLIKEYQSIDKALLVLFFASIVALPSNLSKTWRIPESYYQGIFYEYWAPKLFASQLLLISLLLAYFLLVIKNKTHISAFFLSSFSEAKNRLFSHRRSIAILIFLTAILGHAATQPHPERFLAWFITVLLGPIILLWISKKERFLQYFPQAMIVSSSLQAILCIYQYFAQKSLTIYQVLGETQLSRTLFLAKSTLRTEAVMLPYGTTPHPNILAGWLLLGITALLLIRRRIDVKMFFSLLCLHLFGLLLTESFSAWATLPVILIFFSRGQAKIEPSWVKKAVMILLTIIMALAWTLLPVILHTFWPEKPVPLSISRRARPIIELIEKRPGQLLSGAGLGQSFPVLNSSESEQNLWKYPQPLHNSGIILVFELGFCILLLLSIYSIIELNSYSLFFLIFILNLPILYLDHYLTTQIVGQYILVSFYLFFVYKRNETLA
jgi:hypothetical protein